MEGIAGIIAELVAALAAPLLGAVAAIASVVLETVAGLFGLTIQLTARRRMNEAAARLVRRLTLAFGAIAIVGVLALGIADLFFLDAAVNRAAAVLKERGIGLTFEGVEGNLFTGRLQIRGVAVSRISPTPIELQVEQAEINVSWIDSALGWPTVSFSDISVQGVTGTIEHRAKARKRAGPRIAFDVERLEIRASQLKWVEHTAGGALRGDLVVDGFAGPIRSHRVMFDLLFRSNGSGTMFGQPFKIATGGGPGARTTQWRVHGLPVQLLAGHLGGPFTWLESGRADLVVDDTWSLDDRTIHMDYALTLHDFKARTPQNASPVTMAAVNWINRSPTRLPLQFSVAIDRDEFHGSASSAMGALGESIKNALVKSLTGRTRAATEAKVRSGLGKLKEAGKAALDGWRRGKSAEEM